METVVLVAAVLCAGAPRRASGGEKTGEPPAFETGLALRNAGGQTASAFARGETITLIVTIHNRTDTARTLTLPTSQTHDCAIAAPDGAEIWQWSKGRMFAQVLTEMTFEAGEARSFELTWDQVGNDGTTVAPGRYVAIGSIHAKAAGTTSAPVELTIR